MHLYFYLFWNSTFGSFLNLIMKETVVEVSAPYHKSFFYWLVRHTNKCTGKSIKEQQNIWSLYAKEQQYTFVKGFP